MVQREPRATVVCARCKTPIVLREAARPADEFSVSCARCGQRGFYRNSDIKTSESEG